MPLVNLVIALIIIGMLLWLINRYIPMASSIKTILNCRRGGCSRRLGIAGNGTVGAAVELSGFALIRERSGT